MGVRKYRSDEGKPENPKKAQTTKQEPKRAKPSPIMPQIILRNVVKGTFAGMGMGDLYRAVLNNGGHQARATAQRTYIAVRHYVEGEGTVVLVQPDPGDHLLDSELGHRNRWPPNRPVKS